jgi:hypothetical protein
MTWAAWSVPVLVEAAHPDEEGGGWSPSAPAMGKPHGCVAAWLRKLGPSRTSSERTFEHCVSPSLTRTQRQSHAPIASRNSRPSTSIRSENEQACMAVLVQARTWDRPGRPYRVSHRRWEGKKPQLARKEHLYLGAVPGFGTRVPRGSHPSNARGKQEQASNDKHGQAAPPVSLTRESKLCSNIQKDIRRSV